MSGIFTYAYTFTAADHRARLRDAARTLSRWNRATTRQTWVDVSGSTGPISLDQLRQVFDKVETNVPPTNAPGATNAIRRAINDAIVDHATMRCSCARDMVDDHASQAARQLNKFTSEGSRWVAFPASAGPKHHIVPHLTAEVLAAARSRTGSRSLRVEFDPATSTGTVSHSHGGDTQFFLLAHPNADDLLPGGISSHDVRDLVQAPRLVQDFVLALRMSNAVHSTDDPALGTQTGPAAGMPVRGLLQLAADAGGQLLAHEVAHTIAALRSWNGEITDLVDAVKHANT